MAENAKLIEFNGTAQEVADLMTIAKETQEILKNEHKINISLADAIPTIGYVFLYATAKFLERNRDKDRDVIVNLMNMIEMGITYRESPDDSEKSGNFTPFVQAGTTLKTIIKSDDLTEGED